MPEVLDFLIQDLETVEELEGFGSWSNAASRIAQTQHPIFVIGSERNYGAKKTPAPPIFVTRSAAPVSRHPWLATNPELQMPFGFFSMHLRGLGTYPKRKDSSLKKVARWVAIYQKLPSHLNLPAGWDGYQAVAPAPLAVQNAQRFLEKLLPQQEISVEWAGPTNDDSVLVSVRTAKEVQEWDFYGDGDIAVTIIPEGGEKLFLDVDSMENVQEILNR